MEQLNQLKREYDDASSAARDLFAGSTHASLLLRRPGPGCWCAVECLEHLVLTHRAYLPRIDCALGELRARKWGTSERTSYRLEPMAALLRWYLEPPYRLRQKTPAAFEPAAGRAVDQVLADFLALQEELALRIDVGRQFSLNRVKLASPFAESMRYNVYSALVLVVVHQRRHLWQAGQVRKRLTT